MKQGYKYSWSEMEVLSENWRRFAKENNGRARTIGAQAFGYWQDPVLRKFELDIPFSKGEIKFSTSEFKPLKIRYNLKKGRNLDFLIYPEDFTDKIGKLFGFKEIEIGDYEFDKNFIIKGNGEKFITKLFDPKLRGFLLENYVSNFKLTQNKKVDTLELNIVINELQLTEMTKTLQMFQHCINLIEKEK